MEIDKKTSDISQFSPDQLKVAVELLSKFEEAKRKGYSVIQGYKDFNLCLSSNGDVFLYTPKESGIFMLNPYRDNELDFISVCEICTDRFFDEEMLYDYDGHDAICLECYNTELKNWFKNKVKELIDNIPFKCEKENFDLMRIRLIDQLTNLKLHDPSEEEPMTSFLPKISKDPNKTFVEHMEENFKNYTPQYIFKTVELRDDFKEFLQENI